MRACRRSHAPCIRLAVPCSVASWGRREPSEPPCSEPATRRGRRGERPPPRRLNGVPLAADLYDFGDVGADGRKGTALDRDALKARGGGPATASFPGSVDSPASIRSTRSSNLGPALISRHSRHGNTVRTLRPATGRCTWPFVCAAAPSAHVMGWPPMVRAGAPAQRDRDGQGDRCDDDLQHRNHHHRGADRRSHLKVLVRPSTNQPRLSPGHSSGPPAEPFRLDGVPRRGCRRIESRPRPASPGTRPITSTGRGGVRRSSGTGPSDDHLQGEPCRTALTTHTSRSWARPHAALPYAAASSLPELRHPELSIDLPLRLSDPRRPRDTGLVAARRWRHRGLRPCLRRRPSCRRRGCRRSAPPRTRPGCCRCRSTTAQHSASGRVAVSCLRMFPRVMAGPWPS